jgi:DNA-damage-inducible protein J
MILIGKAQFNIRLEPELKDAFTSVCKEIGFAPSALVRVFMKQVVQDRKIPFEIRLEPNAVTVQAMLDDLNDVGMVGPFSSVREMMDSILGAQHA